jgi:hypothetical protein
MTFHQANTVMRLLVFFALSFGFAGFLASTHAGTHGGSDAQPALTAAIQGR